MQKIIPNYSAICPVCKCLVYGLDQEERQKLQSNFSAWVCKECSEKINNLQ